MDAPREFLLPPALGVDGAARAMAAAWRARGGGGAGVRHHPDAPAQIVVLDTFDGLLRAAGLRCRWEEGRLTLLDLASGAERASVPAPAPGPAVRARDLPSGRATTLLEPVLEGRALLPLARIGGRAHSLDLLDDEAKTVVRIRVEQAPGLEPRVRVLALRGYDEQADLACRLLARLGLRHGETPLDDEAVQATGHPPEGISAKVKVALEPGQPAQAAAARVLLELLAVIEANLPGTLEDLDLEFLHDLRVSVRRSRAVQREFKEVLPAEELAEFRAAFRWLQQATGDARDLDVYVEGFAAMRALVPAAMQHDLEPLRALLGERRRLAHVQMRTALRSPRAHALLVDWREFLERLRDNPAAEPDVATTAAQRIRRVYRRMVKMGEAITAQSPAEDYHELRKKGKELRYLLELFGAPLFPDEVVAPMVKRLKALQDVLGHHQDREIQQHTLRRLAAWIDEPATLLAMGALLSALAEEERAARAEFAESFAEFAARAQRRRVRETFG